MSENPNPSSAPAAAPPPTSPTPISNLPQLTRVITSHNAAGQAVIHSTTPFTWSPYDASNLGFSVPYTTSSFPPDLNGDADIADHERVASSGTLGLVNPRGTVLRSVDFAPGYACGMHRTQSLDYGIVLEGEVDMVLDSGERVSMKRGDVAVQRATQHQWVNRSQTEWARMMFVLQDCGKLVVGGREMGEDLGETSGLPASGN
ncbi:hypothetical protein N658DRAFT_436418 [Parathielavia hyrcaniae]|uniref:Cupin type-2 domain-containing protein n=1 Tax=Parathielavia hyrcaniae TaxID=113614 RepID=A0AAN6PQV3_9PEZI|nr:hypothetical protein N658DRAFT_436418 [Parathielavia hyrcaniae]